MNWNQKKKCGEASNDEVEEMLREAEDATLLKLNLNSHMAHVRPSDLHPDLESRFQALKSGSANARKPGSANSKPSGALKFKEEDLSARFAALKASMPKQSMAATSSSYVGSKQADGNEQIGKLTPYENFPTTEGKVDGHDDEDEVDSIIRWATDAARLDPSPPSDDEGDHKGNHDDDDSGDESDDRPMTKARQTHK